MSGKTAGAGSPADPCRSSTHRHRPLPVGFGDARFGTAVEGKLLKVGAGIAEFRLSKGTRVVIEGPATFEKVVSDGSWCG